MSESESDDDLRPHQLGRREFGHRFFPDSDDDESLRDYDSDDGSSLPSFGSGPPNDMDEESDDDSSPPNRQISTATAPNLPPESTTEVEPSLPERERQEIDDSTARKGRSKPADHLFQSGDVCVLSFDLEHGGDYCGIVQLSAELMTLRLKESANGSATADKLEDLYKNPTTFNEYVNPGENAIWDEYCTGIHGIRATDDRIKNADGIKAVWGRFLDWFRTHTRQYSAVILVAWNGENCDLKWLWRITQAPRSPCSMPDKLQFFMDPYKVITNYKSCKINPLKSKLESLSCGSVFHYLYPEEPLDGLHDSLVDCKVQSDIIVHSDFVPFINRISSIQTIDNIFKTAQINEWKRTMEPTWAVHGKWEELTADNDHISWQPSRADDYNGPSGGPKAGPTTYIVDIARETSTVSDIFFGIMPLQTFHDIRDLTHKYCYVDTVIEREQLDRDGGLKKKKILVDCEPDAPGARHRVANACSTNLLDCKANVVF